MSVLTQRYDDARSGCNTAETTLTPANVGPGTFGKLFSREVAGEIYAQPLIVAGLKMPTLGKRNVVFVATQSNNVYAFDADDPAAGKPLWEVNLGTPVPTRDLGSACGTYSDFSGEVGITGTPVIDAASQTIYLVARTKDAPALGAPNGAMPGGAMPDEVPGAPAPLPAQVGVKLAAVDAPASTPIASQQDAEGARKPTIADSEGFHQYLHAIDITTGKERAGSPIEIKASVPGTGAGSVGGKLDFNPRIHNQRTALLLHQGFVTICWAGHCDTGPYHGWIMSYNAQTLKQTAAFCTTPNGGGAGIWQSGGGPTIDERGLLYLVTGNGSVDTDRKLAKPTEFGSSVLRFNVAGGKLEVADWFTPYNYTSLGDSDLDTGSTSVILVPGTDLIATGSKAGVLYLLDRRKLGGFDPFADRQIAQSLPVSSGFLYSTPLLWKRAGGAPWLYSWGMNDRLKAFELQRTAGAQTVSTGGASGGANAGASASANAGASGAAWPQLNPQPISQSQPFVSAPRPGGMLTLSSNGNAPSSGIVWALTALGDANNAVSMGTLHAFDASDLGRELWNSGPAFGRDGAGYFAKFCAPVVANGKVYLASFSGQLQVYGLNPAPQVAMPTILSRSGEIKDFVTIETRDPRELIHYTLDGSLPTIHSPRYRTPFLIEAVGQVRARAFRDGQITSAVASKVITDLGADAEGGGLIGQYFPSRDLQGTPTERLDAQIDEIVVPTEVPLENWSARWTGFLQAPQTGTYTLTTFSDDGARLWFDDELLVDNWKSHAATRDSVSVEMEKGKRYPIMFEYFEITKPGSCQLLWTPPGGRETVIPQSQLYASYNTGDVGSGTGLTGNYYPTAEFQGKPVEQLDAQINDNPLPPGIPDQTWSARWFGTVQATHTGPFTFSTLTDDGVRLWVDGKLLIDDWNIHAAKENSATIPLERGKKYRIVMSYFQGFADASRQLMWTPPGEGKTLIPATQLYPDNTTNLDPGLIGSGQGLTVSYFDNPNLQGGALTLHNQPVNAQNTLPQVPENNWSARWSGQIQATHTGTFTLSTISDDGIRLWLGNKLLIDNWMVHSGTEDRAQVELVAGQKYPIYIEYFQGEATAECQLKWTNPLGVTLPVPLTQLYDATPQSAAKAPPLAAQFTKPGDDPVDLNN